MYRSFNLLNSYIEIKADTKQNLVITHKKHPITTTHVIV